MQVVENFLAKNSRLGFEGVDTDKFFVLDLSFVPVDFVAFDEKKDPLLFHGSPILYSRKGVKW